MASYKGRDIHTSPSIDLLIPESSASAPLPLPPFFYSVTTAQQTVNTTIFQKINKIMKSEVEMISS